MANDVKTKMIGHAVTLLARKGLQGASLSEVLLASGAPRGSLYHHFPGGKDELVLAALDAASGVAASRLDALAGLPAIEVVEGFVGLWRTILVRSGLTAGCAVLAVTVAADSSILLDRAAAVFRGWRAQLTDLLIGGGVPPNQAPSFAALLIAAVEGGVALARAEQSLEPFDQVAESLKDTVARVALGSP